MKPKEKPRIKAIPGGMLARIRAEATWKWRKNTPASWVGDSSKELRLYAEGIGTTTDEASKRAYRQHQRLVAIAEGTFKIERGTTNMSAFFCHDATVDDVVWAIRQLGEPSDISDTKLGQALLAMNKRALTDRYEERADGYWPEMDEDIANYEARPATASLEQAYKSTCCFTYQCAEGDVPDEPLYGYVDRAEDALAKRLMGKRFDPANPNAALELPAVERAEWGRTTRMPFNGHKVKAIVQPVDGEGNPILGNEGPIFWQAIIFEQPGEPDEANLGAMFSSHANSGGTKEQVIERLRQRYGDALEIAPA